MSNEIRTIRNSLQEINQISETINFHKGKDESILSLSGICKHFGALKALDNVSFDVKKGQIFSLIGPNGSGKSTLINVVTGYYPTTAGETLYLDKKITGISDFQIAQLGISRTFQKIKIFPNISVIDNVLIGTYIDTKSNIIDGLLRPRRERLEEKETVERSIELLRYVGIEKYWDSKARELSYGDQRRLEISRALATQPKLLLLDEPVAGMNPFEKHEMISLIRTIRDRGVTVLLIEHDMNVVMGLSDNIVVLDHGIKIAEGNSQQIQANRLVIEAYLGKGYENVTSNN